MRLDDARTEELLARTDVSQWMGTHFVHVRIVPIDQIKPELSVAMSLDDGDDADEQVGFDRESITAAITIRHARAALPRIHTALPLHPGVME